MLRWSLAFLLTETLELPIHLAALRRSTDPTMGRKPLGRRVAIALGASALTHPVVWFVFPAVFYASFGTSSYLPMVAFAEAFAVTVEALYLRHFGVRRPFRWSFVANLVSFVGGLVVRFFDPAF